jgi:predicted nucleic acid-binding protein
VAKAKLKGDPPPLIYVDTCVWVDLLAKRDAAHPDTGEPRWKSAKALFDAIDDGRVILGASSLLDAEVGCFSLVRDAGQDVNDKVRGWLDAPTTKYTDVDRFLARDAVRLSKILKHENPEARQPQAADAVHVAAAIRLGCGYLMTHDGGFPIGKTVDGVIIVRPQIVWEATLLDDIDTA